MSKRLSLGTGALLSILLCAFAPSANAQHPTAVTSIVNSDQDTTLEMNSAGGVLAPGKLDDPYNYSTPNDSIPTEGKGVRMMWYPEKAAFRAGRVGELTDGSGWDADNIGVHSVAMGVDTKAKGDASVAMGDEAIATGDDAVAIGLTNIATGEAATAMGAGAKAASVGSVVWNDGTFYHDLDGDGESEGLSSDKTVGTADPTGKRTFTVGAQRGVRFITGFSSVTYISGGSTGWSTTSSRAAKTNIDLVDSAAVLSAVKAMPVSTWEYEGESGKGKGVLHIGPMAEDFHGQLPYDLGSSHKNINSINADGVALAAVKGLAQQVERQQSTIDSLRTRVQQVESIKKRVARLESGSSRSIFAGLFASGPNGLGLLLLALGSGLAVGLLWRRS